MMGWYHNGVGWGGWLVMVVGMVAFWGLVVWAVIGSPVRFGGRCSERSATPR